MLLKLTKVSNVQELNTSIMWDSDVYLIYQISLFLKQPSSDSYIWFQSLPHYHFHMDLRMYLINYK